jgi:hypothetical protein
VHASSTYGFWLGSFFQTEKLPALILLIGMVLTFIGLRANTRAIRRGVKWWPGNIRKGRMHVHHMVIGPPVMFIIGVLMFATQPKAPWLEVLALLFGGAAGAVFDEFALILHLRDVYWAREGRQSVVAVFLGTSFTAFMVVGLLPLSYSNPLSGTAIVELAAIGAMVANLACVVAAFLKGRVWMGWVGLFIPVFAVMAAVRLARPWSVWARWRYKGRPAKMTRAQVRAVKFDMRWGKWHRQLADFIAGAPSDDHEHMPVPVEVSPLQLEDMFPLETEGE